MSRTADYSLNSVPQTRIRFGPAPEVKSSATSLAFKLLIVFLLVFYSNIAQVYPQISVLRPAFIAAMAAAGMMVIEKVMRRDSFKLTWPQGYLLIAFLGVAVVSTFQAIYVRLGYETTIELGKIALIYLVIENTVTSESRVRAILWTLVIGGLFPAIGTIYHFTQGIFIEGTRASWVGIFKNPNELAYSLVLLIPIALILAGTSQWRTRVMLWGIIAVYILAIYLTFSRGGLLGLFAVLGVFGWRQRSPVLKVLMVAALVASLALVAVFWNRKDDFKNLGKDTTVNQRIATIKAGIAMFADNPLLGVGPGCSLVAYPLYVPKDAHCGCQDQLVIHNAFIQVLSEMGIIGFVVFMAFIGVTAVQMWRLQRTAAGRGNVPQYAGALELAFWGFAACGVSGGFSYTWFPYILVGVAVALKRIAQSRTSEDGCLA